MLAVLRRHDVEFVVIGGFCLAAHGYVRGTKDVDIMPGPDRANLHRLWAALEDLDAQPVLGDLSPHELAVAFDEGGLIEAGGNWVLSTRYGRLDVMQHVKGVRDYEQVARRAVVPDIPALGVPTRFAGRDDLIAMKHAAGRAQDLQDIAVLERPGQRE